MNSNSEALEFGYTHRHHLDQNNNYSPIFCESLNTFWFDSWHDAEKAMNNDLRFREELFIISRPVPEPPVKALNPSSDSIVIKVMFGDGDKYESVNITGFNKNPSEQALIIELSDVLERMLRGFPNGKSWYDFYNEIEGFDKWFNYEDWAEENKVLAEEYRRLGLDKFFKNTWPVDGDFFDPAIEGTIVYFEILRS